MGKVSHLFYCIRSAGLFAWASQFSPAENNLISIKKKIIPLTNSWGTGRKSDSFLGVKRKWPYTIILLRPRSWSLIVYLPCIQGHTFTWFTHQQYSAPPGSLTPCFPVDFSSLPGVPSIHCPLWPSLFPSENSGVLYSLMSLPHKVFDVLVELLN